MKTYNLIPLLIFISTALFNVKVYADIKTTTSSIKQTNKMMTVFIDALNADDNQAMRDFVNHQISPTSKDNLGSDGAKRYISYLSGQKAFHGKVQLNAITRNEKTADSYQIEARVKSINTELWYQLKLTLTADKPYQVNRLSIEPTQGPTGSIDNSPLTEQQLIKQLDDYVQRISDKQVFSGAVLIAKNDKVLYQTATGLANRAFNIKNDLQTKFNLGSMNKMFTAVSVLQLVEADKLSLDDKLVQFVDATQLPEGSVDKITVRHLLTHTSGLGNYFNQTFNDASKSKYRKISDYLPLIKGSPLRFEPGSRFGYSSSGMLLLGLVIEKSSGQRYFDYVREHIYQPAKMINSDSFATDLPTPNLATGYLFNSEFNRWQSNHYYRGVKGGPAGGGYSTVQDLHNFAMMLTQYKLLSKDLTEQAYSAKPQYNSPGYGYGFGVGDDYSGRVVGHDGVYIGVSSLLSIQLDAGYVVIVLSNQSFGSVPVSRKIDELLERVR